MNNLSQTSTTLAANELKSTTNTKDYHTNNIINNTCIPIPNIAIYTLIFVLILGVGVSIFILAEVHNAAFFLAFLFLSALVAAFLIWNILSFRRNAALLIFLRRFPHSDIKLARDAQLVKLTGVVTCGNVALESSYGKVGKCVYTSTVLYEFHGFHWRAAYIERFSTDFYILDRNSGIPVLVKAVCGCRVVPLVIENRLMKTKKNRLLSPNLTKWLTDRNLLANPRLIRLQEGYIKEGDHATVIGMLHRGDDDTVMVVQPPELISTGCFWQRLLLPVDFDGLILAVSVTDCHDRSYS